VSSLPKDGPDFSVCRRWLVAVVAMMIALVSGILAVVLICTLTVIVLLCRARWRRHKDRSSSSSSSSWGSSTSRFSSSVVTMPRIIFPRAAALPNFSCRRPALLGTHVWRQNNTGKLIISHRRLPHSYSICLYPRSLCLLYCVQWMTYFCCLLSHCNSAWSVILTVHNLTPHKRDD